MMHHNDKDKTIKLQQEKNFHTKIPILGLFFRPRTHGRSAIYGQKHKLAIK